MPDDGNSLANRGRLFGQSPQPPNTYRPGLDDRAQFRRIANGESGPPPTPYPLLDQKDLERAQLMTQRLVALIQNTNITASRPAYNDPHQWSTPVDLSADYTLPAAVGQYVSVITYYAPPGRRIRINGYGVNVGGGFTYDSSILWRIQKNGANVETLADWGQQRGTIMQPRNTFILLNGDDNDQITFQVRRAVAAGGTSAVTMCLTGWTYRPRFNYEGTKAGITTF